jgi:hypothetical protein
MDDSLGSGPKTFFVDYLSDDNAIVATIVGDNRRRENIDPNNRVVNRCGKLDSSAPERVLSIGQ